MKIPGHFSTTINTQTNFAIVQLSGREFPGVVFQGDSLHALTADLRAAAGETESDEKAVLLQDIIERLASIQKHYEAVLQRERIPTPYAQTGRN